MVFEWDDLGCDRVISDQCRSHDCRDQLDKLHVMNPAFKATLFAIPQQMTPELYDWCRANSAWVELGVHGWAHTSNYEAEDWSESTLNTILYNEVIEQNYAKLFRAPGWQISDGCYKALQEAGWVVCDQDYNNARRPVQLDAWVNYNGEFRVHRQTPDHKDGFVSEPIPAYHGHTWDVGWNGIYEDFDKVSNLVLNCKEFKFVSELF
jgi:hypothetical protein